jgi:hypothetical protein
VREKGKLHTIHVPIVPYMENLSYWKISLNFSKLIYNLTVVESYEAITM